MGGKESVDYTARNKINLNDWTTIETNDQYKIVRDKNGLLAEEYDLATDTKLNQNQQLEIYDFRRIQNQPVVKVYGVNFATSSSSSCCGRDNLRKVLTQRIPHRLSTIGQITFQQALYTLSQSLRGYHQITKKIGPSYVSANMIGITSQGFVKVWINDIWAENHPPAIVSTNKALQDLHGSISESKMVSNLFSIVQAHTQGGKFPQAFRQNSTSSEFWTFQKAQNLIRSYAIEHNIIISESILIIKNTIIKQQKIIQPVITTTTTTSNIGNTSVRFNYISKADGTIFRGSNPIVTTNTNIIPNNVGLTNSFQPNYKI